MKKIILVSTAVAAISAFSVSAATFQATLAMNNTINVTEDTPLDFGIFAATYDGSATTVTSSVVLAPTAGYGTVTAATPATSNMVVVTPGTSGQFSVTGVPAFAPLTIEVGDDTTGTAGSAMTLSSLATAATFSVSAWTGEVVTGSSPGTSMNLATAISQNADATGNFTFALGATLSTVSAITTGAVGDAYPDVSYTGSYYVDVSY
jgi:hypothetical protein